MIFLGFEHSGLPEAAPVVRQIRDCVANPLIFEPNSPTTSFTALANKLATHPNPAPINHIRPSTRPNPAFI